MRPTPAALPRLSFHFITALLVLTLVRPLGATVSSPELSLETLSAAITRFEKTRFQGLPSPQLELEDRTRLGKPFLSQAQYRRLEKRFAGATGEVAYRLARHAFLLDLRSRTQHWINRTQLENSPPIWKSAGLYLKGLHEIRQGKTKAAQEAFSASASQAPARSEIEASANLALARLAFEEGEFSKAQTFFSHIAQRSATYEESLDELAWTHLKLGRNDLATTDVQLLFTLYPHSRRLPEAGHLLGKIYENEDNLEKGIETLERLAIRFEFEEAATKKILRAFKGSEEELLFELDPRVGHLTTYEIVPPTTRHLLRAHPVTRGLLAELRELNELEAMVHRGKGITKAAKQLVQNSNSTTVEGVTLLEWANDVERRLLKLPMPTQAHPMHVVGDHESSLQDMVRFLDSALREVVEIEKYLQLNWMILGGERQDLAVKIKQEARTLLREFNALEPKLVSASIDVDAMTLRLRRGKALDEATLLEAYRGQSTTRPVFFSELDRLRERIVRRDRSYAREIRAVLPRTMAQIPKAARAIAQARRALTRRSSRAMKKVLAETMHNLSLSVNHYRWRIAQARFKQLRTVEADIREIRQEHERELSSLEDRFENLDRPLIPRYPVRLTQPVTKVEIHQRRKEVQRFAEMAKDFVKEVEEVVSRQLEYDQKRYEDFAHQREEGAIDQQEIVRQEAILAYKRFSDRKARDPRVPYALYRLAQLHFERAETMAMRPQGAESNFSPRHDYSLAISPLTRLKRDHLSFPHRDNALYLLAYAYLESGKRKKAAQTFLRLVQEHPKSKLVPEVQLRIGEHYFQQKTFDLARKHYEQVLKHGFNYFYDKALYKLAWSNYLLGRYDSAITYFLILLDYSDELPAELKERYVQFADEAQEYVAFSMFRSGGIPSVRRVFSKVGWKDYGLPILERMSQIYVDRGKPQLALASLDLALTQYPKTSALPRLLEGRIKLLDGQGRNRQSLLEKERALRLLARNADWREHQEKRGEALAQADQLLEQATFSLATQYDVLATGRPEEANRKKAQVLYRRVVADYSGGRPAYDSRYRLAELAFLAQEYPQSIANYDRVVRDGAYSHHFADSLFGLVVCREKQITEQGGLKKEEASAQLPTLVQAIDNLAQRVPDDPRVPEALYRSGYVSGHMGNFDKAKETYLQLAQQYPQSRWSQTSLLAALDAVVAQEKWNEASELADSILSGEQKLDSETKTKIASIRQGAHFKLAESHDLKGEADASIAAYFSFAQEHPTSDLASKALWNAFAVAKRENRYDQAHQALDVLEKSNPQSAEAKNLSIERALLFDRGFEVAAAAEEYKKVLASSIPAKFKKVAAINYAQLIPALPSHPNRAATIRSLARKLDARKRGILELQAAEVAVRDHDWPTAMEIWTQLAQRKNAPTLARAKGAAEAARQLWQDGKSKEARKWERLLSQLSKRVKGKTDFDLSQKAARVAAAKTEHMRRALKRTRVRANSPKTLANTFKRKTRELARMEAVVLDLVQKNFIRESGFAMYQLGLAYLDFKEELEQLKPPASLGKEEKENFQTLLEKLRIPVGEKGEGTLKKSLEVSAALRISEPYLPELQTRLGQEERAEELKWARPRLPAPPPLVREEVTDDLISQKEKRLKRPFKPGWFRLKISGRPILGKAPPRLFKRLSSSAPTIHGPSITWRFWLSWMGISLVSAALSLS